MASKNRKKNKIKWSTRIILSIVIVGLLMLSLIWVDAINTKLGLTIVKSDEYGGDSTQEVIADGTSVVGLGNNLNIHFVDVGQGDSCIIELPDGKTAIIDGGDGSAKQALINYIDTAIDDREEKFTAFDYAILTHPDEDHCGSLDDVLKKYPTKVFYRPNVLCEYSKNGFSDPAEKLIKNDQYKSHNTMAFARALTYGYNTDKTNGITTEVRITDASNEAISIIKPDFAASDPSYYELVFFAPVSPYFADVNDYSPIIILEYQGKRVVLSGDAEKQAEEEFVSLAAKGEGKYARFTDTYSVNVIKLGHHGSRTSSSQEYLQTLTTPDTTDDVIIIISCALVNKYKHPHKEVLERLIALGFKEENIIATSKNGNLGLAVKGEVDAQTNAPVYNLYYGADVVRYEQPKVGNSVVKLTWQEIVFSTSIIVVLILIVSPIVNTAKKHHRKAMRKAEQSRHKR